MSYAPGKRFGRLVLIAETDERRSGSVVWRCQCDCGAIKDVSRLHLQAGSVKSCGCLRDDLRATEHQRTKPVEQRLREHYNVNASGCWEWTGPTNSRGYGQLRFRKNGTFAFKRVHRLAYEVWIGPIADGMYVCHKCDNPPCINPAHLFLGTQADNIRDAVSKGRIGRRVA